MCDLWLSGLALAQVNNTGLIVAVSSAALNHREQIVALAARHKLPAVYTVILSQPAA